MDEASTQPAHVLEWISIVASIFSVALAGLAIWLSLYFYKSGKATDKSVATALAKIDASTATMERLAGRQITTLVKAISKPNTHVTQLLDKILTAQSLAQPRPEALPTPVAPGESDKKRLTLIHACWSARKWATLAQTFITSYYMTLEKDLRTEIVRNQLASVLDDCRIARSSYSDVINKADGALAERIPLQDQADQEMMDKACDAMNAELEKLLLIDSGEDESAST